MAFAAVKAQIEADKRERAQKAGQDKALREGAVAAPPPGQRRRRLRFPGRESKETRL
jgi:hypothetical protein